VRGLDSSSYPILRFSPLPKEICISLLDRPVQPSLGAGGQATCPVFVAVAKAVFAAVARECEKHRPRPKGSRRRLGARGRTPTARAA